MKNKNKTKEQLISELEELRLRVSKLETMENDPKKIEEVLLQSEEKHRILFETMLQGVVYQNAEGNIISANPAAEQILGLTLDQMLGRTSTDPKWKSIHEDGSDFPGDTHPAIVALRTGKEVRNVIMGVFHPDKNEYVWININAIPQFNQGETKPHQVYTTFEDITERKLAEEMLRRTEENFRRSMDESPLGIRIVSADGGNFYSNQAMLDIFGYSSMDELIEIPRKERYTPESWAALLMREEKRQRGEHTPSNVETSIVRKDGTVRQVMASSRSIVWNGKNQFQVVYQDITERKKAEEERERLIQELQKSLAKINTLSGLLPICAWCKKLRNDEGYWKSVEEYISEHTGAEFTHGMCPDCYNKFLAEDVPRGNSKQNNKDKGS